MGIYIKGMEMPRSCNECRFFVDAWCYALDVDDWRNAYNKPPEGERLAGCPLIELPPHGDLIGREWLIDIALHLMNIAKNDDIADGVKWLWQYIIEAPTIIESEGEDG